MSVQACGCPTSTWPCSTTAVTTTHPPALGQPGRTTYVRGFQAPFLYFFFLMINFAKNSLDLNIHRAFPEPPPGAQALLRGQASGLAAQASV